MPPLSTTDEADNYNNGMLLLQQSIEQSNLSGISLMSTSTDDHDNELLSLSLSLTNKISMYKSKLDEWATKERELADTMIETYENKLKEEQSVLDTHVSDLVSVQLELGLNQDKEMSMDQSYISTSGAAEEQQSNSIASRKLVLEKQHETMTHDVMKLQADINDRNARIKEIQAEESKQSIRAQEARDLKNRVKESKQTTIDDLTRGIINYKHLGLDFQKAEGENNLRFIYTLLDKDVPTREFSFVLKVDDDDKYKIANCKPSIDVLVLQDVTKHLNASDDMANLVMRMRKAFIETI